MPILKSFKTKVLPSILRKCVASQVLIKISTFISEISVDCPEKKIDCLYLREPPRLQRASDESGGSRTGRRGGDVVPIGTREESLIQAG